MPRRRKRMKGLVEKPAGSGNWYGTFYDPAKSPQRKYPRLKAHTEEAAEREWALLQDERTAGRYDPWSPSPDADSISLGAAVRLFLRANNGLAESTIAQKRSVLESLFPRYTKARTLSQVTEAEVERFILHSTKTESTREKRLSILGQLFSWAIDEGYSETNPARTYKRRRQRGLSLYAKQQTRRRRRPPVLPRICERMCEAAHAAETSRARTAHNAVLYTLAMTTGLRISELRYLNWRDVDLRKGASPVPTGFLQVRCWENPWTGERFRTKNGKNRSVPLVPRAALVLHELWKERTSDDEWAPVLVKPRAYGENDTPRLAGRTIEKHFAGFAAEAGAPAGAEFHSFRHGFLSALIMLEVSPYRVLKIAGHGDLRTQQQYIHFAEEYMAGRTREVQRQLLAYFCPGLEEDILGAVFPKVESLLSPARPRPIVPVEDALFGGVLYELQRQINAFVAEDMRNTPSGGGTKTSLVKSSE